MNDKHGRDRVKLFREIRQGWLVRLIRNYDRCCSLNIDTIFLPLVLRSLTLLINDWCCYLVSPTLPLRPHACTGICLILARWQYDEMYQKILFNRGAGSRFSQCRLRLCCSRKLIQFSRQLHVTTKITFSVIKPSSCVNRLERQVLAMCTMCLQLCRRNVFANNKQDVFASFSNVCRPFPPRSPNQSKRCWNILIIYISAFLLRVFTSTKHTPSDWILKR